MKRTLICLLAAGIVATTSTSTFASRSALDLSKKRNYCSQTADLGLAACFADVAEEFYRGRAICLNVVDTAEHRSCNQEMNAARNEFRRECGAVYESRLDACDLVGKDRYDPDFAPENFTHPDLVTTQNPYWPLPAGRTEVVRSGDDEIVVIHVTDRVKDVAGVPCRVVIDAAFEIDRGDEGDEKNGGLEYVIGEITDDWYAHHKNTGDVWYCGERVRNFEDGILANQDGSFEAGVEGAKGGVLVPFAPAVGQAYRQEFAMDEAEDLAQVVSLAASPGDKGDNPFACDDQCVQTFEFSPLEPESAEFKYYLHGIGFVKALSLEDGEFDGGSEDLACVGDSLEVIADPSCGVEDVEALQEALCTIDPETFCSE